MFDLTGKVALVTGAGRGVGAGIASALSQQGAKLAINDYFPDRAEEMAVSLRALGREAIAVPFDVSDGAAVDAGFSLVEESIGPVDILVNNVGTLAHGMVPQSFLKTPEDMWQKHFDNNLYGTLHCTKRAVQGMGDRGWGRVVAISSDAGRLGHYGSSIYGAAKAGMEGLMRTIAKEFGKKGVTANSIVLGLINTVPEEFSDGAEKYYSTGRIGTPDDIGAATVYLCSDEASWVTGHSLVVNGGFLGA
ncbi:MAG: SDR family NAD(P)-dependent oxidoreductase [Pseudomonadales bacterium]